MKIDITAYIFIEWPLPKPSGLHPHKATDEEKYLVCGLITFDNNTSYTQFLVKLANTLPCDINNLIEDKIMWKMQMSKNNQYLALGGDVGYLSMIKQLKHRKEDTHIIIVALPPPSKSPAKPVCPFSYLLYIFIETCQFWEEDIDGNTSGTFDFSQLEAPTTQGHVAEQCVCFFMYSSFTFN